MLKESKKSNKAKIAHLYLLNFEIWGMYEGDERSTLLSRRQAALEELNLLCVTLLFHIKEFQSHNSNYGPRIIEILTRLIRLTIHYDVVRSILNKKKQEGMILVGQDQVIIHDVAQNSQSPLKPEKLSINSDPDHTNDKNCLNLNNIEEEEKESSYNIMRNAATGKTQDRWISNQNFKKLESTSDTRQQTTSVISKLSSSKANTISQDLINLYSNEIQKAKKTCSCGVNQMYQNMCKLCQRRSENIIKIANRYKFCKPLYQNWNQPSQDNIGVCVNIKCGHRGN